MSRSPDSIPNKDVQQLLSPVIAGARGYDLEGEVLILFEQLGGIVARICRSRLGRALAEQAARACWVEILRLWPTYRDASGRLEEWLSAVVDRVCARFAIGPSLGDGAEADRANSDSAVETAAGFRRVSRVRVRAIGLLGHAET